MQFAVIFAHYWLWHYSRAVLDIFAIWRDIIVFVWNYFSVSLLLSTLFSPWKKIKENYGDTLDFGRLFSTFFVNLMMRLVGAVIRLFTVLLGLIALALSAALGAAFLALWLFAPVILATFIYAALSFLFL